MKILKIINAAIISFIFAVLLIPLAIFFLPICIIAEIILILSNLNSGVIGVNLWPKLLEFFYFIIEDAAKTIYYGNS